MEIERKSSGKLMKLGELEPGEILLYMLIGKSSKLYQKLYKEENLKCGLSSGAAVLAGINLCKKYENKNVLVILPDDGNRYMSKGAFDEGFNIN